MDVRKNLFGAAGNYGRGPAPVPAHGDDAPPSSHFSSPSGPTPPQRVPVPRGLASPVGRVTLSMAKIEDRTLGNRYVFDNLCAVSPSDFPPSPDGSDLPLRGFQPGTISLSDPQRTWFNIGMMDRIIGEPYDPFSQGGHCYLGALDVEVGFAARTKIMETPFDQDVLSEMFNQRYENQIFAPGQRLIMDFKNVPLAFMVRTVQLVDLSMANGGPTPTVSAPQARGILTKQTMITFYKDAKSPIKLKGSAKRPAANSIIAPDFKFEDMGIGGLDTEFGAIFRRAFASRIFPPGLIEKLGIQHVKGILLFGPPGTGKTLIARQIGKMLNSRPPKIINGPEVLNKFVGQSEENIRKLFADAEKEYKEKGDESGLHIIIFDELDAVCKQRGNGSGGTGVGDSVVNQLLSKLDGVEQLNNILLIGMTNRLDMIDDALLRPGRLEVHMEISLPDESGRAQILKIHTSKMKDNDIMDHDVDVLELATLTKNFSGAEIGGLVKSASSFAFNRHVKVGTVAGVSDDIENMKVNRSDFMKALDEVKPAFGVSEEELETAMRGGIFHFSPHVENILKDGRLFVDLVRTSKTTSLLSVLLHGPHGSGKTALAAAIAKESQFPYVKLVSAENMIGFGDMQKIQYLNKVFQDAHKSPQNIIAVDNIERIIGWTPIAATFSNPVLQAIMVLITKQPPAGRRLLILGTTSQRSVLKQLDLQQIFNRELAVPAVNSYAELGRILQEIQAFDSQGDLAESLHELRDRTRLDVVGVGIKKVLLAIGEARQEVGNVPGRFAEVMGLQMDSSREKMSEWGVELIQ
ncbi:hypothetical protein ACEPPN_001370 [Leptodophora sp. 'Broadleaf-Isolate-01']